MGKNKIAEALQKINSGQPGSPIGPEQPRPPIKVPSMSEFLIAKSNPDYKPGMDVSAIVGQGINNANIQNISKNFGWNTSGLEDFMVNQLSKLPELDPNTKAPKDPNWYKSGAPATFSGISQVLDDMEKRGANLNNARTYARSIIENPALRKKYFGENHEFNNPRYLRLYLTPAQSGRVFIDGSDEYIKSLPMKGTYLERFADQIANMYQDLYNAKNQDYGITPQTQTINQEATPIQGGVKGLQEKMEQANPKLRVIKNQ